MNPYTYDDEHQDQVRISCEADLAVLFAEQWAVVYRVARRVERTGPLTPHTLVRALTQELCLQHRDMPFVQGMLRRCVDPSNSAVERERRPGAGGGLAPGSETAASGFGANATGPVTATLLPSPRKTKEQVLDDCVIDLNELHAFVAPAGEAAERQRAAKPSRAPFAVAGDNVVSNNNAREGLAAKEASFRQAIAAAAQGQAYLTRKQFMRVINMVERYGVSDRECLELCAVLDPQRRDRISVLEFCDRFSREYLKPKSMRNMLGGTQGHDGKHTAMQWPQSVQCPTPTYGDQSPRGSPRNPTPGTAGSTTRRRAQAMTSYSAYAKGLAPAAPGGNDPVAALQQVLRSPRSGNGPNGIPSSAGTKSSDLRRTQGTTMRHFGVYEPFYNCAQRTGGNPLAGSLRDPGTARLPALPGSPRTPRSAARGPSGLGSLTPRSKAEMKGPAADVHEVRAEMTQRKPAVRMAAGPMGLNHTPRPPQMPKPPQQ